MKKGKIISCIAAVLSVVVFAGCLFLLFRDNGSANDNVPDLVPSDTSRSWVSFGVDYDTEWEGSGTADDPWLISSAEELAGLSYLVYSGKGEKENPVSQYSNYFYFNKYFKQTADIDLSEYWWQPIGIRLNNGSVTQLSVQIIRYFSGNYDGDGHTVSGVFTRAGSEEKNQHQGLFGYVQGTEDCKATIKNIGIKDSKIQGYRHVGAIAGLVDNCEISNCYNEGAVQAIQCNIGGIVGWAESSTIKKCYNKGNISSDASYVGGIVGEMYGATIADCYNDGYISCYGKVDINKDLGGIVASAGLSSVIENCHNSGKVENLSEKGSKDTGGIGGCCVDTTIKNCYNTGNVIGGRVGGIVGYMDSYSSGASASVISSCYNVGEISGSSVGGIGSGVYHNSIIINCYNAGNLYSTSSVGGISDTECKLIANCYNMGEIHLTKKGHAIGGVVSSIAYGGEETDAQIINCFNIGNLVGKENAAFYETVGFLWGEILANSAYEDVVSNCYFIDGVAIGGDGKGGETIQNANLKSDAKTQEFYLTGWDENYAWDFDTVWTFDDAYNNGLPILAFQIVR